MKTHILVAAALVLGSQTPVLAKGHPTASIYAMVTASAEAHGVNPALAHAVVKVESGYKCSAHNPRSSAAGLMQTLRSTARGVGVHGNLSDCRTGLEAGMRYLKKMLHMAHGNLCATASAYNRGSLAGCTGYGRKVLLAMRRRPQQLHLADLD